MTKMILFYVKYR